MTGTQFGRGLSAPPSGVLDQVVFVVVAVGGFSEGADPAGWADAGHELFPLVEVEVGECVLDEVFAGFPELVAGGVDLHRGGGSADRAVGVDGECCWHCLPPGLGL